MLDIPTLLQRADALAQTTQRSEATVSKWLFRDANTLKRLREGRGSVTVATLIRAFDELRAREISSEKEAERLRSCA